MELSDLFLDHGRIAEGEPLSVFDTVLANTVGVKECEHSEDSGVQLTFCDVDDIDGVISSVSRRLPDLPLQPLETSPCADWVQEQYEDKCTWDSLIRSKTCSAWTPNTPDSLPYSLPASPTSNFQALSCRITSSSPLSSQTTKTKAQSSKKQDLSSRLDLKMQAVLNSKKRIATSGFTADTNGESSFDGNLWQWKRQQRLLKNRESSSESRRKKKEYLNALESQVKQLTEQHTSLLQENKTLRKCVEQLQRENTILKCHQHSVGFQHKRSTRFLVFILFCGVGMLAVVPRLRVGGGMEMSEEDMSEKNGIFTIAKASTGRALLAYNQNAVIAVERLQEYILNRNISDGMRDISDGHRVRETGSGGTALMKRLPDITADGIRKTFRITQDLDNCFGKDKKRKRTRGPRNQKLNPVSTTELATLEHSPRRMGRRSDIAFLGNLNSVQYKGFLKAIKRKADTFYVVSLKDHLLFPAENYNKTQRPKMSFMMPSMSFNGSADVKEGEVSLMQIDCEVLDTHTVSVLTSDIEPVNHRASMYSQTQYHSNQNISKSTR